MKHATVLSNGRIKELPEGEMPTKVDVNKFIDSQGIVSEYDYHAAVRKYESDCDKYLGELLHCLELEIVGTHTWKVGDTIEEDKHYRVDYSGSCFKWGSHICDSTCGVAAFPIKQEQETQYQLLLMVWNELDKAKDLPMRERIKAHKEILESITITRK